MIELNGNLGEWRKVKSLLSKTSQKKLDAYENETDDLNVNIIVSDEDSAEIKTQAQIIPYLDLIN